MKVKPALGTAPAHLSHERRPVDADEARRLNDGDTGTPVVHESPGHGHGAAGHGGHGHGGGEGGGHQGHGHGAAGHGAAGHGGHGHGGHGHGVPNEHGARRAFIVASSLNLGFVVVEFTYGALAGSTALVADASHNLSDVLGLALAWGASWLHHRRASKTLTYGYRKSTVLASLANALILVFTVGAVMWEAMGRLASPEPVNGVTVMIVAAIGVFINMGSAVMFLRGARSDLNLRGAYLHLVADAAVSLAVVLSGLIIALRPSWVWLDPLASLCVSGLVLWSAWRLLREALHLTLDGVPDHLDTDAVKATLKELPGVLDVADLHVWAMSTSESAMTAHLIVSPTASPRLAQRAGAKAREVYGIEHTTIQIDESAPDEPCSHC